MHIKPSEMAALERVERAATRSKQPRFGKMSKDSREIFFSSMLRWTNASYTEEPPYKQDSRTRDKWLTSFWRSEPHLAGIMSSVNAIDANRSWHLTGGRNQVARFLPMFRHADDGAGWRQYVSQQSAAFYGTDMGALTETGRDGKGGPLREIYHLDPTKCFLTGHRNTPLKYDKSKDEWTNDDFFRLVSMKDIREDQNGLGFCAVSRCVEMTKIMLGVYGHELEQIGAKAPRGLLLLQNIDQDQWQEAMKARDVALDSDMRKYYNAVAVIAQMGVDTVDAKLIALSSLPEGFDIKVFTDLLMYAYALCFDYDSNEFWPGGGGAIGRGRETDIQHRKGTGKGGLNFMLAYQDQMEDQLPSTLEFAFEERDPEGEMLEAAVSQAWANVVATLVTGGSSASPGPAGPKGGAGEPAQNKDTQSTNNPKDQRPAAAAVQDTGILTVKEGRHFLAMKGVIPMSWTEEEENVKATDTENVETERDRLMANDSIRRAVYQFPDEPIVRYTYNGVTGKGRTTILFNRGEEILSATRYTIVKPTALIPPPPSIEQARDADELEEMEREEEDYDTDNLEEWNDIVEEEQEYEIQRRRKEEERERESKMLAKKVEEEIVPLRTDRGQARRGANRRRPAQAGNREEPKTPTISLAQFSRNGVG